MHFSSIASCALALARSIPVASATSCPNGLCLKTQASLNSFQVASELGPLLSEGALIFGPDDPRWANATERYQTYLPPKIRVVVEPAVEADVPIIVKYANNHGIPFLTVNRAHGYTITLNKFDGLQVNMAQLRKITISKDQKSALMQGGVYSAQVIQTLWGQGYVTSTGSCGCVGILGPGLGGGHGRYQGMYGLVSDAFIKLNVVLANGSAVTVSDNSHQDLFWAMRGAGHNFGIVTSFQTKIWPKNLDTWYYRNLIFTQDKLEALFTEFNKLGGNGTQPKELAHYGMYLKAANFTDPVIWWSFSYTGSQADAEPYLKPFNDLGFISFEDGNVPYPDIAPAMLTGIGDPLCKTGLERISATAGLQVFNLTTQRQIYELYEKKITQYPEFVNSWVVMEQYSVEGVRAVDPASQAYPMRDDYLLMAIDVAYTTNPSLDAIAFEWVHETRDLWNAGQPERKPTAYVNYAMGDEPIEQWYGWEPWRLEKLRALKRQYDPHGRFSYYNPITY